MANAANECFYQALQGLEQQLARESEQELARKTLPKTNPES
jgi:hypothetical protein